MLFLYIVLFIIFTGVAVYQVPRGLTPAKRREIATTRALSDPAKRIKKQYDELPSANQPYSNILYILKALDTKHEVDAVNSHFSERYRRSYDKVQYRFNWNCGCYRQCTYNDYKELNKALSDIQDALDQQRRALEVAGVSDGLSQAESLTEHLRRERDLINEVTKELV